jgi:hypothetical protein
MYWLIVLFERQQAASPAPQYHLLEEIRQCGYRCEVTKLIGTLKIVPAGLESVPKAVGGTYLFMAGKEYSALFRTPPILACRIRRSLILKSGSAPVRTVLEVRGSRLIHSWSAGTDTFPLETLLLED